MLQDFRFQNRLNIISIDEGSSYYDKNTNTLFVNRTVLPEDMLVSFIRDYPYSHLRILSSSLITDSVLQALCDNSTIHFIKLGSSNDPYLLNRTTFDLFSDSLHFYSIDTDQVEGIYNYQEMECLGFFQQMVGKYKISDLVTESSFTFFDALTDLEIHYLETYLSSSVSIQFRYDDYANIILVMEHLKGRQNQYQIPYFEDLSKYFSQFAKFLEFGEKIEVMESNDLAQYILVDTLLEDMVRDIKESNMSPYEQFLAVYEIVTHFKSYLDPGNQLDGSKLDSLLFNHFYVCRGFSALEVALLQKIGIASFQVSVEYYKESENVSILDQAGMDRATLLRKLGNIEYHSRVLVHLVDPKYDIDGIFLSDPTWDHSLDHHYFDHSLMTFYEVGLETASFYETDVSIFGVHQSEEFLNFIQRKPDTLNFLFEVIQCLDPSFYQYLKNHYGFDSSSIPMLLDLYQYIIRYTKKAIDQDQRKQALKSLFSFIYSNLDLVAVEDMVDQIIRDENERNQLFFRKER